MKQLNSNRSNRSNGIVTREVKRVAVLSDGSKRTVLNAAHFREIRQAANRWSLRIDSVHEEVTVRSWTRN